MFRSKDSKPDHKRHVPIRRKSSRRFIPLFRKSKDALRRRNRKKISRSKGRVNRESGIHKFRFATAGPARAGFVDAITALIKAITRSIKISRGRECMRAFSKSLFACPSFHGGRGALPSAGGHPSDLTFLAGGGCC
ncbi:PREDICTED: L484_025999 [Prunus dulcis]|uniref:PREDICTED: L484_025999 n=1 Tax=Prunus dulcis TaxID=3755 RepID=A0A5E4FPD3_PRUDU|nr:PREDICTED: L484_025999 [Prunus dulcis]